MRSAYNLLGGPPAVGKCSVGWFVVSLRVNLITPRNKGSLQKKGPYLSLLCSYMAIRPTGREAPVRNTFPLYGPGVNRSATGRRTQNHRDDPSSKSQRLKPLQKEIQSREVLRFCVCNKLHPCFPTAVKKFLAAF